MVLYTVLKIPYFPPRSSRTSATGGHLHRVLLELNVNLEAGEAGDLNSKHFSGEMPRDIIFGQKRTNSPLVQLRLEVKCVSLKVATYQHFKKIASIYSDDSLKCGLYMYRLTSFFQLTFIEAQQNAIFLNFMQQDL